MVQRLALRLVHHSSLATVEALGRRRVQRFVLSGEGEYTIGIDQFVPDLRLIGIGWLFGVQVTCSPPPAWPAHPKMLPR